MSRAGLLFRALVAVGVLLLVAACGGGRDAAGPTARLHAQAAGAEGPMLEIDPASWQLVGSRRVSRTVYEYTYRASVRNRGTATTGVSATLSSRTPHTWVIHGEITFGDVGAGEVRSSTDMFTIQHDRTVAFDPTLLVWTLRHAAPPALEGPLDALALALLPDRLAPRVAASDLDGHTILTRLRLALVPGATVTQLNAAAARVGGRIVSSAPGSPFLALGIARAASHAELMQQAQSLDGMPGIALAYPASTAAVNELPAGSRTYELQHLRDSGFPAAWNTRKLMAEQCRDNPVRIVQVDMFGRLPDSYADFDQQLPEPIFARSSLDLQGVTDVDTHGYDVALTLAAAFDARRPTGAIAAPECVRILPFNALGLDSSDIARHLRQALEAIPGRLIVSSSIGFGPPKCGARADQDCKEDSAQTRLAASQTPSAELRRHLMSRVASAIEWGRWLHVEHLESRVLLVQAAGNSADELISRIFPGFGDARLQSELALADELGVVDTLLALPSLWKASAEFASTVSASALLTMSDGEVIAQWLTRLTDAQRRPFGALALTGALTKSAESPDAEPQRSGYSSPTEFLLRQALYARVDETRSTPECMRGCGLVPTIDGRMVSGTSYSAPQAAGLAATLWALSPELRARPPADTLALLRATGRPLADGSGVVLDAYAAVLALDAPGAPGAIRRAILDVNGDGRFDHEDLRLFAQAYGIGGSSEPIQPTSRDYGRYDLNGDGFTGGSRRTPMDLDARQSPVGGTPIHTDSLEVPYRSQPLDERAVSDLDALCYYAYSPLYVGSPALRDELLDAAVCGDITIEVTFPELATVWTAITVRVLEAGQPVSDGSYGVRISAVCGELLNPEGPLEVDGTFTTQVRPLISCGPTLLLTIRLLRLDGSIAATRLVDARVGLPFASYIFRSGTGFRIHQGTGCALGRLCTLSADDDGISLSLGSSTADQRVEGRASVTICPGCGTPDGVWVHGRRTGRSTVTVISGPDAWRVEVYVGESGISLGQSLVARRFFPVVAFLTPIIRFSALEEYAFSSDQAILTDNLTVGLNIGDAAVVRGVSHLSTPLVTETRLVLVPGEFQVNVRAGGPVGGGQTAISLTPEGSGHFTPASTRVLVVP